MRKAVFHITADFGSFFQSGGWMTFLAAKDIKNRCTPVMVASVLVSVSAKLSADTG